MKPQTPEYVTHDAINGQKVRRLKSALRFCVINYDPACKRVGVQACKRA